MRISNSRKATPREERMALSPVATLYFILSQHCVFTAYPFQSSVYIKKSRPAIARF